MIKDFDNWNSEKKRINSQDETIYYHQREVWWCALGVNVGFEQDGTGKNFDRPILVLKGFNRNSLIGIPLTGRKKLGKYYFFLGKIDDRNASAVLSQIRLIDSRRLIRKMKTIDEQLFIKLKTALKAVLLD